MPEKTFDQEIRSLSPEVDGPSKPRIIPNVHLTLRAEDEDVDLAGLHHGLNANLFARRLELGQSVWVSHPLHRLVPMGTMYSSAISEVRLKVQSRWDHELLANLLLDVLQRPGKRCGKPRN